MSRVLNRLKQGDVGRLAVMLSAVCETDAEGFAAYHDGHSDKSVAASAPFPCTPRNVEHLREKMIGAQRPKPRTRRSSADLERRVIVLEAESERQHDLILTLYRRLGEEASSAWSVGVRSRFAAPPASGQE